MQDRDEEAASAQCDVMRCVCGSLLARYVRGGIELKCRRCKRTIVIAHEDIAGTPSA
ncbi:MAG TPA: hypothetical protein VJR89_09555 [Polyangiales bacterium]|nr:hypothetical protein [Polyangiales bacterium]